MISSRFIMALVLLLCIVIGGFWYHAYTCM